VTGYDLIVFDVTASDLIASDVIAFVQAASAAESRSEYALHD
jgi:hypothetical protein